MCYFETHLFVYIKSKPGDVAWIQYRRQWRKAAQRLLNSCFDMRVCATLWIIYTVENIPTALNTDVRCSPEVQKSPSLLRWATCRHFFIFLLLWPEKNFNPNPCSSQCTIQMGCNSMHAKCKTLHSLAFFKLLLARFGNSASSDSFVMHYCTCLHLNKEVTF